MDKYERQSLARSLRTLSAVRYGMGKRGKYKITWNDIKQSFKNPIVLLAYLLIFSGVFTKHLLEIVQERQNTDEVYKDTIREILHYDTPYYWVFLLIMVLVNFLTVLVMRKREQKGLSNKKHVIYIFIETIIFLLFFLYMAYM